MGDETLSSAPGTLPCHSQKVSLLSGDIYSPHCEQAGLEAIVREIASSLDSIDEAVERTMPQLELSDQMALQCWALMSDPDAHTRLSLHQPPSAYEQVSGINFE